MQGVAIGLGFVIPLMFLLGAIFAAAVGHGLLPGPQDRARAGRGVRRARPGRGVSEPLSPTDRTRLGRLAEKGRTDRRELHALLDTALVAHVGLDAGGYPLVLPTAYAVDLDGPDRGGTLYLHGSVAARWLVAARGARVCVTITEVDGLVAARSGFESSMNYRTAVVLGDARVVEDDDERLHALDLMVDHMVPGRAATIRRPTRKELAATQVLALCRCGRPRSRCAPVVPTTRTTMSRTTRGAVTSRCTGSPERRSATRVRAVPSRTTYAVAPSSWASPRPRLRHVTPSGPLRTPAVTCCCPGTGRRSCCYATGSSTPAGTPGPATHDVVAAAAPVRELGVRGDQAVLRVRPRRRARP